MTKKKPDLDVSFNIEDEIISRLDALCDATGLAREYHVDKALREYAEREMRANSEIDSADVGLLTPFNGAKKHV